MARGQHVSRTGIRSRGAQLALGGVVLAAAGITLLATRGTSSPAAQPVVTSAPPTASRSLSPAPSPSAPAPAAPAGPPRALVACAQSVHAAETALAAAAPGVTDWQQHVQAYDDVVAGRTTSAAADSAWTRTEQAGPADKARWGAGWTAYQPVRGACAGVAAGAGPAYAAKARACAQRGAAADAAVVAAGGLMQGWTDHLQQMADRDAGGLSPGQARVLFRQAARQAPQGLQVLQADRQALATAPACTV